MNTSVIVILATVALICVCALVWNNNDIKRPEPVAPMAEEANEEKPEDNSAPTERDIYNLIIVDESGSMSCVRESALNGVNETISNIVEEDSEHKENRQFVSVVAFSSREGVDKPARTIVHNQPASQVKTMSMSDYVPGGGTPLYDAIGLSVKAIEEEVSEKDVVLVTIITDGYENTSRIYNSKSIMELIARKNEEGWVFTYIGANQDSNMEGRKLGIDCTLDFERNERGVNEMWEKERDCRRRFYEKTRQGYSKDALRKGYFE